jgi:hypothetical protein
VVSSIRTTWSGPRAFVVGAGERADLQLPEGDAQLLPRHVAVVVEPHVDGAYVRAVSLHPERGLFALPLRTADGAPDVLEQDADSAGVGGAVARGGMRIAFDGLILEIRAQLDVIELDDGAGPALLQTFPLGTQLSFFSGPSVRAVGDVVASIGGPAGGGHAIPALLGSSDDQAPVGGTVVLRTRTGVHRVEASADEIRRGLLVGRSRRCVLGRGFDENDGLSRVHALVLCVDDAVLAFDLASRYGLRDVSRPNRITPVARLDDGIGCLVYGAGLLTYEPS